MKVKIISIIAVLLGLSFFSAIPIMGSQYFSYVLLLLVCAYLLSRINRIKKDYCIFLLLFFFALELAVNIHFHGDTEWNINCLKCIICILFIYSCYITSNHKAIVHFILTCNVWNIISFVDVLYRRFFTIYDMRVLLSGYDNGLGAYLLPLICLNGYLITKREHKKAALYFSIIAILQLIIVWSATAISGAIILIICYYIANKDNSKGLFGISNTQLLIVDYVAFFVIVIYRRYENVISRFIIEGIFHKTMDFSTRTYVWDRGILYFLASPIIGNGRTVEYQRTLFYGVSSAHNYFLDILTQVGLIGAIIMTIVFIACAVRADHCRDNKPVRLLALSFFGLILALQFESYCAYGGYAMLYVIITMALLESNASTKQHNTVPVTNPNVQV